MKTIKGHKKEAPGRARRLTQYCQLPNKNTRHILKDILILCGI
jgi:hypothetical protein